MKHFPRLLLALWCCLFAAPSTWAQSGRVKDAPATASTDATGEPAQNARAVIVIQAAKKDLLPEAESRLAEYAKNQPQVAEDRYNLESWMVTVYFKAKDYERAQPHAREMFNTAKLIAKK